MRPTALWYLFVFLDQRFFFPLIAIIVLLFFLQGILRDEMGEYGLVMEVGIHATEPAAWLTYQEVASITSALGHATPLM